MSRVRRSCVALVVGVIAAAGCGSEEPAVLSEPVVGGDLVLTMEPGDGVGTLADQIAQIHEVNSGIPALAGTPTHHAWFDRTNGPDADWFFKEGGPINVVSFTLDAENPRGGGPWVCVQFGGGGGCHPGVTDPHVHQWGAGPLGGFLAQVYGGDDAAEAVVTTESGKTVSVLAASGYAHAEWPEEWGEPKTVDFYARNGDSVLTLEFEPYGQDQ